ncbi:MAG: DNA polymerase III subunit delta, partial [Planctomycetota bacterium]
MIDAAADGRADDALQQIDRLLASGEEPHALLPQMSATLRRFNAATLAIEQAERRGDRPSLRAALEHAGVVRFKLGDAETQLRQIGRER